ncbi:hypothetical protein KFE26_01060 [Shewanella sp. M16]|uniref:toxin-antitoxin system YwqK family antitoxin n=1 Tax=Shewanella sp. M16 TaxID=2830837 RepID=UPI001BB02402|nr:hypothetical protein [Shewanella sp. M16]MBS0040899.1 hypothetical protein [Shewanella sp. M16]
MELSIRSLFTAAGMMLLSSLTVIPAASAAGKAIHPTVDLPNGQWLNFHQKDNQVWSEMSDGDAPGVHLDDYGAAEIVAVFYYDFDKGGDKEVVVMLKDADGQHLRGYGFEDSKLTKLPRLQVVLDEVAPTLSSFTVSDTHKVLNQIPPQQYRMTYDVEAIEDPAIKAIIDGSTKLKPTLIGYRNAKGLPADVKTADEYKLRYPLTRKDKDAQGREHQYSLVTHFYRNDYREQQGSFVLVSVVFEADDVDWLNSGEGEIPKTGPAYDYMNLGGSWAGLALESHYAQGVLDGPYIAYDNRNANIMLNGQYKQGKKVGKWMEADGQASYWEGEYLDGKKQGKWIAQSMFDEADNYGFAHYNQGVLDGPYEIYEPEYGADTGDKRLSEKGIYRNGVKDGEWLESNGNKGHYQNGIKQGPWVDKVSLGEYRNYVGNGAYLDGKRTGPWVFKTDKKSRIEVTYLNGLREGEEKLISDENVLFANKYYKQGLLDGQSIWYSAQDVVSGIRHYRKGEYHGMQAIFDPNHNHRLMELSHYEYDETLPVKPSQDECIMREKPYSNDCKDIVNSSYRNTPSIKHGEQYYYDSKGKLYKFSDYHHGNLIKEYEFDEEGHVQKLQNNEQGQDSQISIRYKKDGGYSLSNYSDNEQRGWTYEIDNKDRLLSLKYYHDGNKKGFIIRYNTDGSYAITER